MSLTIQHAFDVVLNVLGLTYQRLPGYICYRALYRIVLWPCLLSPLRHLPGPPTGNPLIGQWRAIVHKEAGIPQREWVKKYGPVVSAVGPIGVERLIFTKPEALHRILVSGWLECPRPSFLKNILGLVAGYGLLTVTGNEHKQMRKAMNPAFSIPNLMAQTDMYYDSIESLIDILRSEVNAERDPAKGKEILMYDWMSKVTLDIICETAFGYKPDSLHNPHNELAEAYENLIDLQSGPNIARFILLVIIPGFPYLLASQWGYNHRHWFEKIPILRPAAILMDSMHRIKTISRQMLAEKTADLAVAASDTEAKRDIMSLLVRARTADKGEGYQMSDTAMMDQVLTFLGAGHETTASGLAWTLWLLANDTAAQDKLRHEVSAILANNPRPDYRTLKDLQWLDCVVMESLRVLPPVPMTVRKAAENQSIDGTFVPKGTLLYIPIRVVNTWKEIWGEDAEEFRPERWLNLPKEYNSTFSLLSFIAGPHACIGKTMAIMEMKAILAGIIAKFAFEPAYVGQVAKPTAAITMKPADGMPLRVRCVAPTPVASMAL
ncbi:hypothetical protein SERLA73DRAFT_69628 [Serpula lacrymans var. lacrymans S7.3]|uniref:Cytochrome P450 n=1 Tax=Serpula lacrymans var. lacrymans (strain S7.3) TaxID=936435 RepID=F8PJX7_SERL3|nr:hypothetical protein SERLA73DRAFT_69628 [Serpula lacrymans var. lacrymans S7.3]